MREKQLKRLGEIRRTRDQKAVDAVLNELTEAARNGTGNMLEIGIRAAKLRATVGEISYAIEEVCGRHVATDSIVRGAYSKESMENTNDQGMQEYTAALKTV